MHSDALVQNSISTMGIHELHVWRIPLDTPSNPSIFEDVLSPDEEQRARRFRMESIRKRFVVTHGVLRRILASYTECSPKQLTFQIADNGKPQLSYPECPLASWHFNLSHSGDFALVAVAKGSEVGVDIEIIREDVDWR